jgi:hypothetical protein
MQKLKFLLAFWLTIAATGVWADTVDSVAVSDQAVDTIPDQVKMGDGTMVTARRLPRRAPDEDYTYTYKGVKYTYITGNNYTRFFDLNAHAPWDNTYAYRFDDDGWLRYTSDDGSPYIVAATIDEASVPANGEVFILNDLVGYFKSHTHLTCVADQGFSGESRVKRIYFQDSDAWSYNSNTDFMFFIAHRAFNNAPQLEKIDLMQYITKGDNHWEPMPTNCITRIWSNMLEGSPNAMIRVATSTLNDYRSSSKWSQLRDRIISYEPSGYEINEYGVRYKCMLAQDGKTYLTNDGSQREEVMKQLRLWNADYQSFNAANLLASSENGATVYYTTAEGCDASYLKKNDGVARIYNDVGSYYNYKTIAIRRGAFSNCDDLKAVEFYQTNGRSENSYSSPKICIENGAFRGCKNLKEIRLYYYVEDGDNHWETLGPEDVVPGDDIFGWKADYDSSDDIVIDENEPDKPAVRFIVSPTRYMEFINDPNWARYSDFIVPADYEPTSWSAMTVGGLTYDYASKTPNAASTSQVVTVEASWWNVPVAVAEIVITILTSGSGEAGKEVIEESARVGAEIAVLQSKKATLEGGLRAVEQLGKGVGKKVILNYAKGGKGVFTWLGGQNFIESLSYDIYLKLFRFLTEDKALYCSQLIIKKSGKYYLDKVGVECLIQHVGWAVREELALYLLPKLTAKQTLRNTLLKQAGKAMLRDQIAKVARIGLASTTSAYAGTLMVGQFQPFSGQINEDQMKNGLADNLAANIHQLGLVGFGLTTPDKKLIYHTYIKEADPNQTSFIICNDIGSVYNYRTVGVSKKAFQGNTKVKYIGFAESRSSSSDSYAPLMFTIPDSAFAGCTSLRDFDLRYMTTRGSQMGLGPENFVLCGDSIFAGCDSTQLRIIVAEDRLQDFLDNASWSKYKRFITTGKLTEKMATSGYGVKYAYAYNNNSTRHITYAQGHEVEHLYAYEADDEFLKKNSGSLGLFNDIGNWNNYHLDYVKKGAFQGNQNLKQVSFWNVNGISVFGESYEDINITLQDESFKDCQNLESVGLVFMKRPTTTFGSVRALTPAMIRLGDRVFDNTPKLMLKMMPQQVEQFMADSAWASYKDKFMPCLITPVDAAVKSALSDLRYTLDCSTMNNTWDIIDMSRLKEKGFSWLDRKFDNNTKIKQFPEFKQFELVGLDYVANSMFYNDKYLTAIELPSTIKRIESWAFYQCDLREIDIPAGVTEIGEHAFYYNPYLKTVRCLGTTPAEVDETTFGYWKTKYNGPYPEAYWGYPDDFKIYVPAEAVNDYKKAWSKYADYIVADEGQTGFPKEVTTTAPGQLASKLGLETIMDGDYLVGLTGSYWKMDSLTVSGPLNGVDIGVLRFLGGADVNNSEPTFGQLRYLNMYNARLQKDTDHPYQCWGRNNYLKEADVVGDFMFCYCDKLQTVILPKEATKIGQNVFEEAHNLKRLCVGDKTIYADNELFEDGTEGLEELVFLEHLCTSDDKDCWEPGANAVYVQQSKLGDYLGRNELTSTSGSVSAAFEDDEAGRCFVRKGYFFPSEFLSLKSLDGILTDGVKSFNEQQYFNQMTDLGSAFAGCSKLERVTLSESLRTIGYSAFQGCKKLTDIYVSADSVAKLESGAFRDLPADFRIYVPKTHAKRYREAWSEYAEHIVGSNDSYHEVMVVTVTEPNTLARELGLKVDAKLMNLEYEDEYDPAGELIRRDSVYTEAYVTGISGDYRHITRLKVNGPISGQDIAVLRYLSGFCAWTDRANLAGRLEYIDLYDARVVPSPWRYAQDKLTTRTVHVDAYNVLPAYAFLQAYQLKTLILPKTLREIRSRAIMQCEALQTVVIGDSIETINWSAFDDDVSLTRLYLLAEKKPELDADNFVWRNLCNNYNPTFDAFYVRPSLYNDYISDNAYVGSSWQRTNNISTGLCKDDDAFAAFAAHAAATEDDLGDVTSVEGWFRGHENLTDLTPLRYTLVDSLKAADMKPLTKLTRIAMPMPLAHIEENSFADAKGLRWADFMMCDSTVIDQVRNGGLRNVGLPENVLCFMPSKYGETDEVNVIVGDTTSVLNCATYRLVDGLDYDVPYAFKAAQVENTRTLAKSNAPYTICLPYALDIPTGAKAYKMSGRSSNELIFTQTFDRLEALQPYLIWADQSEATLGTAAADIPTSGGMTYGRQDDAPGFSMRGTLERIDNGEAADLGAYTLQQDGLWHPVMNDTEAHRAASILPYRAYLLQNRVAGAPAIGMILEDATGVEQLRTIDSDVTERIYDLNGRMLSVPANGVNIINGKKVIIRK